MSDGRFGVGGQGGYLGPGYGPLYLDMLVDVTIGTPTNQYVLTYNSTTEVWEPQPAGGTVAHDLTGAYHTESGLTVGHFLKATGISSFAFGSRTFTISSTIKTPDVGYTIVWRAPIGCTCTKLEGRQKGGTSTVIQARYNGTTDVATSDLTLTAADTWYSTTGINQTAWIATDWLEWEVVTLGSATEITFVLTFTEP